MFLIQFLSWLAGSVFICSLTPKTIILNIPIFVYNFIYNNLFIDVKDRRSLTPLHYACQAGNLAIAKLLVEYGSNVNIKGFGGTTPLHIAVSTDMLLLS